MRISLIIILISFSTILNAQKVKVYENKNPNALDKPGYNLIFQDEFDSTTLDKTVWNISGFNNDGTVHCTDPNDEPFTMNPQNVWVEDGVCKIAITDDDYLDCDVSAGEIKSYSVAPGDSLKSWTLDYGFYIEIRLKNLPIEKGLGSAGWLFAAGTAEYNEIDLWETDGEHKYKYGSTYWWEESDYECSGDRGLIQDHSVFKVKNLDDKIKFLGIRLGNRRMDLTNQWLVFGVDWDEKNINYYLNDVKTKEVDLTGKFNENKPCDADRNDKPIYSKNVRIGTQPNSLGDKESSKISKIDLPKTLSIDYVRIWAKNGINAVKFLYINDEYCIGSSENMICTYFPGAKYTWSSSAFTFLPNNENIESSKYATVKTDILPDQYYLVSVIVTFPSGYVETLTKTVYISTEPIIPDLKISTIQQTSSCYYSASIIKPIPETNVLWSADSGTTWQYGIDYTSNGICWSKYGEYYAGNIFTVKVKIENSCGMSDASPILNFTTPLPSEGCWLRESEVIINKPYLIDQGDKELEYFHSIIEFNNTLRYNPQPNYQLDPVLLSVYNLQGIKVLSSTLHTPTKIDISFLPTGIYLATIENSKNLLIEIIKFYKN